MSIIALRIVIILTVSYLFGLLVAWLFSLFNSSNCGDDFGGNDPDTSNPPQPGKTLELQKGKKRLVEVDESYYLEEFDLSHKHSQD